jgi:hypothetical protein
LLSSKIPGKIKQIKSKVTNWQIKKGIEAYIQDMFITSSNFRVQNKKLNEIKIRKLGQKTYNIVLAKLRYDEYPSISKYE